MAKKIAKSKLLKSTQVSDLDSTFAQAKRLALPSERLRIDFDEAPGCSIPSQFVNALQTRLPELSAQIGFLIEH